MRWAVIRTESDETHLRCRHCNYHWARRSTPEGQDPTTDTVELRSQSALPTRKQPGWLTMAIGAAVDAFNGFLVAFGEWWDGTSIEQIEKHERSGR
ncbi:MAG: hypothetical protein JXL80_05670 [Planctomycetes bacterium]|nr:hypothetical protein [Planctomycetota bacterium]